MSRARWVADGQVLQTGARFRGMGQYALELLVALQARRDVQLHIVLSRHFPTAEALRTLAERAPAARVAVLDLRPDVPGDPAVARHNVAVLDRYLTTVPGSGELRFLQLSTMQGTSRPVLPSVAGVPRWALVYDLIPLARPATYLARRRIVDEYAARLHTLLQADGYLTISAAVADDLVERLGVEPSRVVVVGGAPIPHPKTAGAGRPVAPAGPFVLMPTGDDPRKNNRRAVQAFALFNAEREHRYRLVITSTFDPAAADALRALAPGVEFTGALPGAALAELYAAAGAVLFPSELEGLGLPVLEAVTAGRPVACSDLPVFRELSETGFVFFDPESVSEMAAAIGAAVNDDPITAAERARILARYSWSAVVDALVDGTRNRPDPAARGAATSRPRLLLVGSVGTEAPFDAPDAADRSEGEPGPVGAGRLLARTAGELNRRADVRYLVDATGADLTAVALLAGATGADLLEPGAHLPADRNPVYLLDDTAAAARTLLLALGEPGVAVLLSRRLSRAWQELIDAGLVDPSRVEVAQRLNDLEPPEVRDTAALLAAATTVIVADDEHRAALLDLAGRLGLPAPGPRVLVVPPPGTGADAAGYAAALIQAVARPGAGTPTGGSGPGSGVPSLAVLLDPTDEGAPSMELAGEELAAALLAWPTEVAAGAVPLRMPRIVRAIPRVGERHAALNADRLVGRFLAAEATALRIRREHDLFHVVDHVYAHLVRVLPAGRAGVYCHDLDAFRSVLQPAEYPRPAWFRRMTMATLRGIEQAAVVFHSTEAVGAELLGHHLVDPARLVHAPYGVAAEFRPHPGPADRAVLDRAGIGGAPYLLHVGSALPRKRLDVLLDVFAQVRAQVPGLLLVQQGAVFDAPLRDQVARLGLGEVIRQPPPLRRDDLAALYRGAAAALVTSEAEGFGLPVIEALACGTPVVASDLPALREVGGDACDYCPVGAVDQWSALVRRVLADGGSAPRAARLEWASRYTWTAHARTVLDAYLRLAR